MRSLTLSIVAGFVITCLSASAQTDSAMLTDSAKVREVENNLVGATQAEGEVPGTIKDRMAHYRLKGLSVAIIHNYKIEWAKGYGWADEGSRIPVTDQTLFQAASISKSLNAVGVLKLVQDKRLDLYSDINNYLYVKTPKTVDAAKKSGNTFILMNGDNLSWSFRYDSLSKGKKISMANLLSHTAGLNVHGFGGYERGADLPTLPQILDGKAPANSRPVRSMYEPGRKFEYSGGGITISQLIVTDITNQPYDRYMYDNVLKPMGMINSTYSSFPPREKRALFATGYNTSAREIDGKYHIYPEQAAAGLWTNPTDLSKYIIETQLALDGKSAKVLNQQTTKLRLTPYIDKQAALGVFILDMNGTKYFTHSGSNEGFRSEYYGSMEDGNGVVVMVNSDNGDIIPEIVNSVAKVYKFDGLYRSKIVKRVSTTADEKTLQSYTGKYALNPEFILTVTKEGNKLYGQATGQERYLLYPESETKFLLKIGDIELEFMKDDTGIVNKVVIYQGGPREAIRMK